MTRSTRVGDALLSAHRPTTIRWARLSAGVQRRLYALVRWSGAETFTAANAAFAHCIALRPPPNDHGEATHEHLSASWRRNWGALGTCHGGTGSSGFRPWAVRSRMAIG